jgi:hypothetical protein
MGKWESIPVALYETRIHRCDYCGKMVTQRIWRIIHEERPRQFCDPQCEYGWFDYWLPRYGGEHGFSKAPLPET